MSTAPSVQAAPATHVPESGASPYLLNARADLFGGLNVLSRFASDAVAVEVGEGSDSLWVIVRRPDGVGLALRAAHAPGGFRDIRPIAGDNGALTATSSAGQHRVTVGLEGDGRDRLRVRHWLTPDLPLQVPFLPRDLYPLDAADDPLGAQGQVLAAQRGPNTGLVFLTLGEPASADALYVQDLTALNDFYAATGNDPSGAVGGEWPELGYLAPTCPDPAEPLPAGRETALSDALLIVRDAAPRDEPAKARRFLEMLGDIYEGLQRPTPVFRDWPARVRQTLADLDRAPEATCTIAGHRYVRPYVADEYPDSMVQMALVAGLHEEALRTGAPVPLATELAAGMERFFDPELKTLRRYLPEVGEDKNADAVDSWYLYHPQRNLARMALAGQDWARDLFLRTVDYGIRAARHFDYRWPIQYDVRDFSVLTATRNDDVHGQTDVGGFYAYVMLQAFELTGDPRFRDEAVAAIKAAAGMRFELEYQANLTAWGAAACLRLWQLTGADDYRAQAHVYLASFFHNCEIWESRIGAARHSSNFLGATVLHDAQYMAMYECYDSLLAFEEVLAVEGGLDPAARLLVTEYRKYTLHRGWFYYPDALPEDAIATEFRNGHVDRALSFPVEDIYPDGQPAGQVGQEIYGAAGAFIFAARAFHRLPGAPFTLFCNLSLAIEREGEGYQLRLGGDPRYPALLAVIDPPPGLEVRSEGAPLTPAHPSDDRAEYTLSGAAAVTLSWSAP